MGSTTDIQDPTSQNAQAAQTQYDYMNRNPAMYANNVNVPVSNNNFSGASGGGGFLSPGGTGNGSMGAGGQGTISFDNEGLMANFPTSALPTAYQDISNLYGNLGTEGQLAAMYGSEANTNALQQGQTAIGQSYQTGLNNENAATGQALGNSQALTNQNLSNLTNQMNTYDQNFISQLGPQGQLGQQLAGEYNNYGITPSSGAFQEGLGNTLGSLGAQNQLQLGTQLVNQGNTSEQNLLSQGLGGQLSTNQAGAQAGGTLANIYGENQMNVGQQGANAQYTQDQNAAGLQSGIINEGSNIPIDQYGAQQNINFAQGLANQNASAQNNASNDQLYAGLGSAALMAAAK